MACGSIDSSASSPCQRANSRPSGAERVAVTCRPINGRTRATIASKSMAATYGNCACSHPCMTLLAVLASLILSVTPKHGHPYSTYVVSFKAPYSSSRATNTNYVIGAVNSADCTKGISTFGKVQAGPYRVGQTVRFVIRYPRAGLCTGVFHGVVHFDRRAADRITHRRIGRFGFRVLSH